MCFGKVQCGFEGGALYTVEPTKLAVVPRHKRKKKKRIKIGTAHIVFQLGFGWLADWLVENGWQV